MAEAADERESTPYEFLVPAPYDGPALAIRQLQGGVVVEDLEFGNGRAVVEGALVRFRFSGYSDWSGTQVMGTRNQPSNLTVDAEARDRDAVSNAMCDALLGLEPGARVRIQIPAEIAEQTRSQTGDLWVGLELIEVLEPDPEGSEPE